LNWPIVGLIRAKQELDFGDAGIILNASDCFRRIGLNVYKVKSGNCSYNYGESLIRSLNFFGIGIDSVTTVGILFIAIFVIAYVECLRAIQPLASAKIQIVAAIFFASPPVMLLLERGNFDSLIYFLVVFSLLLEAKGKSLISVGLLVLSALFKFYTFPLLVWKLVITHRNSNFFKLRIILVTIIFGIIFRDLARISDGFSIPNPMWFAFGSSKFPWAFARILGLDLARTLQLILGALLSLFTLFGLAGLQRKTPQIRKLKQSLLNSDKTSRLMTEGLVIIFLVSYFSGMSYIYRLVFVIPVFIFLVISQPQSISLINILITAAIFLSPWFGGMEFLGDLAILLLASILILLFSPKPLSQGN